MSLDQSIETCFNYQFKNKSQQNTRKSLKQIISDCMNTNQIHKYPQHVFLKITSDCNLRCRHCFYYNDKNAFNSENDFLTNDLSNLVKFLVEELHIISIVITGGEPFLQKDIFQILKYLKSKNVTIQIQTNATLITEEIASELASILNPKYDNIQTSLEGATAITHDKIRGKGSFEKTINGIEHLISKNFNVAVSYTITSENIEEVPLLYKLFKDLGVKAALLGRFEICSDEQAYLAPPQEQVFVVISSLINQLINDECFVIGLTPFKLFDFLNHKKGKELVDKYMLKPDLHQNNDLACHKHDKMTICADGRIALCPRVEENDLSLGSLKEKSFYDIWDNRFSNMFFGERRLEQSICKECKYVSLCNGGCPASAYFMNGCINAPDGYCQYGKELMKKKLK